ncbi:uncharacterized protein FOMMEDRAFT_29978 [Fomitiporia mediterranea MF3/22]|uniref:uncharacterized protein n=1 Tax=Fomitiporia mediterranea (strain MF3/22) TaxID=694068 RepID=UPI0004409ABB|nr:uncharacterized protein FOMMEDRAFT_29978 [Fomitiporia mediterranea MF3/22]EJD01247.1 hypothetical protein FOMMEDRAFT_29978 [Fomitiporia mediterranea MF3/22]
MTGVVKLSGCGHVFCRKDLAEWIESHHGSCPTCRQIFFPFTPIDETDYESSDGGEYVPDEDEEDDMFTDDGEIELVATSDIDYDTDLDDIHPDEEGPDMEGLGYAPLARVLAAANAEAEANARRRERAARVYIPHDTSEFRVSAHGDDGNEVADDEFVNDVLDFDAPGALSFGSDSPSSEGTSVGNEVRPEHLTTNVELASMHDGFEGVPNHHPVKNPDHPMAHPKSHMQYLR